MVDLDIGLDGTKEQRDVNLVDIGFLGREVELTKTLVLDVLEQIVLEKAVDDGILERRVCFVVCVETSNIVRIKKTVREGPWRGGV